MMGDYPKCEIKLCDFEISRVILEGQDIRELLGTPDYVAPEILHYEPITLAADMWSLGVTTYVLLSGYSPFGGETDQETFCNISRGEVDFPSDLFKDVSNEAIDFVRSLLIRNPRARLTSSECLKHAWLNGQSKTNQTAEVKELPSLNPDLNFNEDSSGTGGVVNSKNILEPVTKEIIKKDATKETTHKKYLSKSRESLFESVIQKHGNYNSKRNTLKNNSNRFRKIRACKSQISLLSKSQEKLLEGENLTAPSRSIEKLYGFRSLSKSQEILSLYKTGGLLASQDNLNLVSEIIKSRESLCSVNDLERNKNRRLMRATTADLGILHHRNKPSRMNSCSSTASFASFSINVAEDGEEDEDYDEDENDRKETIVRKNSTFSSASDLENLRNVNHQNTYRDNEAEESENHEQMEQPLVDKKKQKEEKDEEEEEPRFTVAQLIMAYNKHQEIVTKTSLEVTMSAQEKKVKIPPIIPYKSKSSFPTGPTALRLFIPDIDLVSMPKKFVPKYKMRFPDERTISREKSTSPSEPESPRSFEAFHSRTTTHNTNNKRVNNNEVNLLNYLNEQESRKAMDCSKRKSKGICNNIYNNQESVKLSLTAPQKYSEFSNPVVESTKSENKRISVLSENQKAEETYRKRSPTPSRKLSVTRSFERSPSVTRKCLTVERSPVPQRKTCTRNPKVDEAFPKKVETFSQYKIVGEKNGAKKSSGVSYKIEFDSPVVKRKFPTRNMNLKGTISSNLKVRETVHRARK